MALQDKRETECRPAGACSLNKDERNNSSNAYNRNLRAFRKQGLGKRQAPGGGGALERAYSAAFLIGGKTQDATLGVKRNGPSGGVKLELRMPYDSFNYGDQDDTETETEEYDDNNDKIDGKTPAGTTTKSTLSETRRTSKRDNKISLDELLESNHSKIQQRRRRRHQKLTAQGNRDRWELRKTLSYGQMGKLTQSMSSTDIFNLQQSLHGVHRKRRDTTTTGASGNKDDDQTPLQDDNDSCADDGSYDVWSYQSSSCTSSMLRSDDGIGVDLDYDSGDTTECSGFSIGAYSEHCHSSITMEDWQSLYDMEFDESFAIEIAIEQQVDHVDHHEGLETEELVDDDYDEVLVEEVENENENTARDFGESRSVFTEEVIDDEVEDIEDAASRDYRESRSAHIEEVIDDNEYEELEMDEHEEEEVPLVEDREHADYCNGDSALLSNHTSNNVDVANRNAERDSERAAAGPPLTPIASPNERNNHTAAKGAAAGHRQPRRVAALIAMFEKGCQSNNA